MRFNKETMSNQLWNDELSKPLKHLRVIDLTVMLTGPYVTRILGQYGADIVKVEKLPSGDHLRELRESRLFELLNQGKKSVAINFDSSVGIQYIRQLASEADIFIENFRSGIMDK